MSVYVDRAFIGYGRMKMCHMIADTPSELHEMAHRIGVQRKWFQAPPLASFWHYDIAKVKRDLAVTAGAIDCDRNTFVAALRRIRETGVFARKYDPRLRDVIDAILVKYPDARSFDPCPCGITLAVIPAENIRDFHFPVYDDDLRARALVAIAERCRVQTHDPSPGTVLVMSERA